MRQITIGIREKGKDPCRSSGDNPPARLRFLKMYLNKNEHPQVEEKPLLKEGIEQHTTQTWTG